MINGPSPSLVKVKVCSTTSPSLTSPKSWNSSTNEMVGNASIMASVPEATSSDDLIRSVALRQDVSVIATKEAIKNVRFIFMVAIIESFRGPPC